MSPQKLTTLADAIARHVADGACVALEGFTHLIPFAAGHEIIRQGRRGLHLVRMTPDLSYDQMSGMGCASRLTFSWGGNPGVGSLHRLRDAVEHQWPAPLALDEERVGIDELEAKPGRDATSDGRLAAAHEADEDDVVSQGGHVGKVGSEG